MYYILPVILAIAFGMYTGQAEMSFAVLMHFIAGLLILRCVFFIKLNKTPYRYYAIFFAIYGLLCLLTQMELIKDPTTDFFAHNDAADAFYENISKVAPDVSWDNVSDLTLYGAFFAHYPLAAYLFTLLYKLALLIGIVNIRLFLRIHVVTLAATIIPLIVNQLQLRKIDVTSRKGWLYAFGICTYLYIGSCVFTRDLHVWWVYTVIAYVIMKPECNFRLLKLLILCVMAYGFRPQNGYLSILFVVAYYSYNDKSSLSNKLLAIVGVAMIAFVLLSNMLAESLSRFTLMSEAIQDSSMGGTVMKIQSLSFPIGPIAIGIYVLLQPVVWTDYITTVGGSYLTLPFRLSPFILSFIVILTIIYAFKNISKKNKTICMYVLMSILAFVIISYSSPDHRRAFATMPGLFMAFLLVKDELSLKMSKIVKKVVWPIIFLIITIFSLG